MAGDRIYADDTLAPERLLPDGTTWKNLTIPATSQVAETLQDLRDRYRYHQADDAWRDFGARTGMIATWDDHEVVDNWAPDTWLHDDRYALHDVNTLISGKGGVKHAGPDLEALRAVSQAYRDRSLNSFERALEEYKQCAVTARGAAGRRARPHAPSRRRLPLSSRSTG